MSFFNCIAEDKQQSAPTLNITPLTRTGYFFLFLHKLRYLDNSPVRHVIRIFDNIGIVLHNIWPESLASIKAECDFCQGFPFFYRISSFGSHYLIIYGIRLRRNCYSFLFLLPYALQEPLFSQ